MIRLLGSVLAAGGAAWLGFHAAARLRRQVRTLDELIAGLELLEQELEYAPPELEVLMEGLSARARGAARRLYAGFGRALVQPDRPTAAVLWEHCVTSLEELTPEGKHCLAALGEVLGRYDSREQRACTAAVRRRLERVREETAENCRLRCRTCQTIGLSGGAFLVILLL